MFPQHSSITSIGAGTHIDGLVQERCNSIADTQEFTSFLH